MAEQLISVKKARLSFAGRTVLHDVNLDVNRGEIVTLIGPNGAGKSCLVKGLLGLIKFDSAVISKAENLKIGYLPQKLHIDEIMPVTVNRFLKMVAAVKADDIEQVLQQVNLAGFQQTAIQSLSGGELQRLLLARIILQKADLLVLDEPAQGVDVIGQQELYQLIAAVRQQYQCGILMISHDLHLVMEATDRVLCLNRHICCSGHPDAISQHPEYIRLFGGAMEGFAVYTHHHDHEHDSHGNVVPLGSGCQHWDQDAGCRQVVPLDTEHEHG
ncbi:MAG: zinc ABC transporter ATP-binding protein ZnuC [Gammaproteobacteria bacterium]|nr:zinc ABC transporter ATP-binding protein ZnuC [Gammaproteobacteria bacterium]